MLNRHAFNKSKQLLQTYECFYKATSLAKQASGSCCKCCSLPYSRLSLASGKQKTQDSLVNSSWHRLRSKANQTGWQVILINFKSQSTCPSQLLSSPPCIALSLIWLNFPLPPPLASHKLCCSERTQGALQVSASRAQVPGKTLKWALHWL